MKNTNFKTKTAPKIKFDKGLNKEVVWEISHLKNEPDWMLDFRLKAFDLFNAKKMPSWGPNLSQVNFDDICYYLRSQDEQKRSWGEVSPEIKNTFERLGIPKAEREYLSGVKAQFESEVIYGSLKKELEEKGVIFVDTDSAVQKYPEIFRKYFSKAVPPADNKFAALNSAIWSGGSFIYVPEGVVVEMPLQAYFRINERNMGQFERTLIIADKGSYINYVEGCTAPVYSSTALHAAVVEIFVEDGARVRYTTIQNWSGDVYNLVTKRAFVEKGGIMEWVDCNLGSQVTMKYPSIYLKGEGARGETLSLAYAKSGQNQDVGGKIFHLANNTSSRILSKSISSGTGISSYRGLVKIPYGVKGVKTNVICNALLLSKSAVANTYPFIEIASRDVSAGHEATVSKVDEEQMYYLMTRGLSEEQARGLIVSGFIEPIAKELPMEYAVELNRLIELEMEGAVG
jgi:Fe-S cluster assembly protein SufB